MCKLVLRRRYAGSAAAALLALSPRLRASLHSAVCLPLHCLPQSFSPAAVVVREWSPRHVRSVVISRELSEEARVSELRQREERKDGVRKEPQVPYLLVYTS